ncbi:acetate/propionate family kinase [Lactobacillus gigeriorum]|uniref:Acetate kinase n=1 Tax=Lactobacillus gigeriorum DSM 23908 = CRBIP 24.85 TaxID=1423751 RepID=I7J320_9LACO|nr:acetate kinase [Lactobacillus gigeriorum]KRN14788.1 acetate kinase [Lactobacillus gigeriorum DSM 23908 = CRBIP 24.85]CCI87252.1 Acetate kinase 2 [Lactobacillus gigeriorum DSM 23908 = CRBIP 24.85]
MKKVLAINSGSSTFKYKLFSLPDEKVLAEGMADRVALEGSTFEIKLPDGTKHAEEVPVPDQETAVKLLLDNLKKYNVVEDFSEIVGVGHRIVAGGEEFKDSVLVGEEELKKIFDLTEYAPLHNPAEGRGIQAFMKLLPGVPQVGVFDTAFHQTLDEVHYLYPLPYEFYENYKVRKYGAHGTSVRYVAQRTAELLGKDLKDMKLLVLHLGSGASITAVKNGKSFDTSMGFSPLAGLMMATRSGDVDPSALQFIMEKEHYSMDEMIKVLNKKSGLLGISGVSPDMRDLLQSEKPTADLAIKMFVNSVVKYVGSYIAEMGGVDTIAFTAGIGEHDEGVRASVMKSLEFLGLKPDLEANDKNGEKIITKPDSKITALIVPTDEELMIERDVVRLAHLDK